jgi:hypothetical protein
MVEAKFTPEFLEAGKDRRITIPQAYSEKIPWLRDTETPVRVWLLMMVPGRFRILSDPEVERDPKLALVRSAIIDGPGDAEVALTDFETSERAALIGRLVPATLAGPSPAWRLTLPKQVVPGSGPNMFVLLFSLGHAELWFHSTYTAAMEPPLDAVI